MRDNINTALCRTSIATENYSNTKTFNAGTISKSSNPITHEMLGTGRIMLLVSWATNSD